MDKVRKVSPALVLTVLGMAQFINTYDTVSMNVAISKIVPDLNTTVTGVQLAITMYALVMAAFMIPGAKLGDVWGKKRTFTIGVALYGLGALITAFSVNLAMMVIGWSLLEGLGSALMIPSIYAIIPAAFRDPKERVKAFAVMASVAGAGAASGPLICGIISTYLTWRVSFAAEVVVVIVAILLSTRIKPPPRVDERPKFDLVGGVMVTIGLGLTVLGILQGNNLSKRGPLPVVFPVVAGLAILVLFVWWEVRRKRRGLAQLVDPAILTVRQVQVGLPLSMIQMFVMSGSLFVIPVFQQMALNFQPVVSGLTFLPSTLAMVCAGQVVSRFVPRWGRKWFIFLGLLTASCGIGLTALLIDVHSSAWTFLPGSLLLGTGMGLVMAPLQDLVQSSVPLERQSEISGVSRAFFNLGSSLGTAVAGAVLIAVLISGLTSLIRRSPDLSASEKSRLTAAVHERATTQSDQQIRRELEGKPAQLVNEMVKINSRARDRSLRTALGMVALIGFIGSFAALLLPQDRPRRPNPEGVP